MRTIELDGGYATWQENIIFQEMSSLMKALQDIFHLIVDFRRTTISSRHLLLSMIPPLYMITNDLCLIHISLLILLLFPISPTQFLLEISLPEPLDLLQTHSLNQIGITTILILLISLFH